MIEIYRYWEEKKAGHIGGSGEGFMPARPPGGFLYVYKYYL